jgi:hypothetical protein
VTRYVTDWSVTSDNPTESAQRVAGKWIKSRRSGWLPGRLLTREQAIAGMDLTEIVSTQAFRHDRMAHRPLEQLGTEL